MWNLNKWEIQNKGGDIISLPDSFGFMTVVKEENLGNIYTQNTMSFLNIFTYIPSSSSDSTNI